MGMGMGMGMGSAWIISLYLFIYLFICDLLFFGLAEGLFFCLFVSFFSFA